MMRSCEPLKPCSWHTLLVLLPDKRCTAMQAIGIQLYLISLLLAWHINVRYMSAIGIQLYLIFLLLAWQINVRYMSGALIQVARSSPCMLGLEGLRCCAIVASRQQ